VAVKVVREDLVGSDETAQRFRREARVAASLSHPNIVTIHDFGVTKEARAYLVMELLEGSTIRERLRETGRFTTSQLLPVLRDVCSALDAAHRRQLVHRDLKPENIFLTRSSGRQGCKVLDFGIAKFFDAPSEMPTADTAPGVLLGTPLYMSPEQRQGGPADPTWDLWALSVVAYEMLAGTHPFKELSPSHRLAGRVPELSDLAFLTPDAAVAWRFFFEKTFAADPQLRPRSAEQFQFELDAVFA
jgi:serine/threonine-protein kinase